MKKNRNNDANTWKGETMTRGQQNLTKTKKRIGVSSSKATLPNVKKTYTVTGLGCAHCAERMEREIGRLAGVSEARLDFVNKKLTLVLDTAEELDQLKSKVRAIVKRIEYGADIDDKAESHDHEHDHEHEHHESQNIWLLVSGAVLFLAAVLLSLPQFPKILLFAVSLVLIGGEIYGKAVRNIIRGRVFDENFLMSIASIGAFIIGEYAEGVAVMLFYQIGEYVQARAVDKSRRSIASLMDIKPEYANRKVGNETVRVAPEQIAVGDLIVVKPGEKIPLDGTVVEGTSMLDTSALTGESLRQEVSEGHTVFSGSINMNGLLTVKVTKPYGESTVSKILDLVENASSKKAPTENFITKFARVYTPTVVTVAALIAFIPPLVIKEALFSQWLYRALVFLVISCPCALVISIPLGFFGGIGGASANGILIKGSNYLEALNQVDTVVFDKTGTLTKGVFEVDKIVTFGKLSKDELLMLAAYAESFSNHPIAASVLKAYGKTVDKNLISDFKETAGFGIEASIEGKKVLLGNEKLMKKEKISFTKSDEAGTVVYLAVDGRFEGYIVISDQVKGDSKITVSTLKKSGVKKTVMLTGDKKEISERISSDLGIDQVYAELLPHEKVKVLEDLSKKIPQGKKLLFVGDGINDAPVLARADIGVAMGGLGSDAAIEAADIVLMTDEPSKLISALQIASKTRSIVWQNIILALGVKAVVLVLGAGGIASMWEAVFADVGVALLAILNALRVMRIRPGKSSFI
jgi:Cd2+/Zn2+-exporting ATPase